jgi:hypothetical protein
MPSAERELPTTLVGAAAGPGERFGIPEVYAVIALLSFLVARFVPVLDLDYQCVFRTLTGVPCATCGMTHAFVYMAHGRIAEAFRWSPLGALLAAAVWIFAVADLLRVAAGWPFPAIPRRLVRPALYAGAAALIVNWGFLIVHGLGP